MLRKILTATTAAALIGTFAPSVQATTFNQSAAIKILPALNVAQNTQLNFGIIERPTGGDVVAHVTTAGGQGGSHTATDIDMAARAAGNFTVSGSTTNTISIQASDVGNVGDLEFTAVTGNYAAGGDVESFLLRQRVWLLLVQAQPFWWVLS